MEATNVSLNKSVYSGTSSLPKKSIVIGQMPAKEMGLSFEYIDGDSDYIICSDIRRIFIYAKDGQGVINGVYAFLKDNFNLYHYADGVYDIDSHSGDLVLNTFKKIGNNNFDYAYSGYGALIPHVNGNSLDYARKLGFTTNYYYSGGGIHNALSLIPYETYGSLHPNWFYEGTTSDGYQTGKQLYLACENFDNSVGSLVYTVAEQLFAVINDENNKNISIFNFSPMDIDIWPTGSGYERSDSLLNKYGTHSAELIIFANKVADCINAKLQAQNSERQITIEILAYNKTLCAPDISKGGLTETEKNLVRLYRGSNVKIVPYVAPVECNYTMLFTDSRNYVKNPLTGTIDNNCINVAKVIENWYTLSDELHLWMYSLDCDSYFMPMITVFTMAENYQFAYEHGVKIIFNQSQYDTPVSSDWASLKIFMQSELSKNAYQNTNDLINKFMTKYFGSASSEMIDLLNSQNNWYNSQVNSSYSANCGYTLGILRGSAFYTLDSKNKTQWQYKASLVKTVDYPKEWMTLIDKAKNKINNDANLTQTQKNEFIRRIDIESLTARWVLIKVFNNTTYDQNLASFYNSAYALGVTMKAEGQNIL